MRNRRGFATLIVLFLVGLVTATLAVVSTSLVIDARRTRSAATQAELRQLLLAGGAEVMARSLAWGEVAPPAGTWAVGLPPALAGYSASVHVPNGSAETAVATVTASGGGRRASQQIKLTHSAGQWQVAAVVLDGGEVP